MLFGLNWLKRNHKTAWRAIPASYKTDDCLQFFIEDGELVARGKQDDEAVKHIVAVWRVPSGGKRKKWIKLQKPTST